MRILQISPGAGTMFCGGCLRDNALVAALRQMGHDALMVPLYLPLTLDEEDQSAHMPVFFGGINVYLEQKSAWFRRAPGWLHDLLRSRPVLKWVGRRLARTRAAELGDLTLSMLHGEEGNQARELDQLLAWLKTQPRPDVICLSNAMLLGLARRLRQDLGAPVICCLQGEDYFLNGLPASHRAVCWQTLSQRAAEVEGFIAPSRYFGERMRERLGLSQDRVHVVYNGINLDGYEAGAGEGQGPARSTGVGDQEPAAPAGFGRNGASLGAGGQPTIGYFARMCPEKGLDKLIDAFIELRKFRRRVGPRLRVGGSCSAADQAFVERLRERLEAEGLRGDVEFCPNLDRAAKLEFLRSLSLFSVPALYGEAFGLYLIEALAAGVPVVQPRSAAFPELVESTGGGVLYDPDKPQGLATALEELLLAPARARELGEAGRRAVFDRFSAKSMAQATLTVFESVAGGRT